ncbi:hypothetical protein BT63DRAFT_436246 [Microthyrium microscopicum]|uniref:MARVEL domain-containing protein n=1 Tax=Microthyrium microscopicum TaxID=703497 RepID=A0A6A6UV18_9PEZI|nr:hypothetical protein BT63DRAFT_436246 [Microthyrium microscopicum]
MLKIRIPIICLALSLCAAHAAFIPQTWVPDWEIFLTALTATSAIMSIVDLIDRGRNWKHGMALSSCTPLIIFSDVAIFLALLSSMIASERVKDAAKPDIPISESLTSKAHQLEHLEAEMSIFADYLGGGCLAGLHIFALWACYYERVVGGCVEGSEEDRDRVDAAMEERQQVIARGRERYMKEQDLLLQAREQLDKMNGRLQTPIMSLIELYDERYFIS